MCDPGVSHSSGCFLKLARELTVKLNLKILPLLGFFVLILLDTKKALLHPNSRGSQLGSLWRVLTVSMVQFTFLDSWVHFCMWSKVGTQFHYLVCGRLSWLVYCFCAGQRSRHVLKSLHFLNQEAVDLCPVSSMCCWSHELGSSCSRTSSSRDS